MKHTVATFFATLTLLGAALSAHAQVQFTNGNKLLRFFNGSEVEVTYAMGYVIAVADTQSGTTVCVPENTEVGQITDVVKRELTRLPEYRHMDADVMVRSILKATYPCASKKRTPGGTSL